MILVFFWHQRFQERVQRNYVQPSKNTSTPSGSTKGKNTKQEQHQKAKSVT